MKVRHEIFRHALLGFTLALGAPLGWLLWRTHGVAMRAELAVNGELYLYLALATTTAFVGFGVLVGTRVGALRRNLSVLRSAIVVDPLTNLKNRRYFTERLAQELARAGRDGTTVALLVGDLDHFKAVNDTHGHPVGDVVLRAVATVMNDCCRTQDVACRIGGEEFALILPCTEALEAARVAERVRCAVSGCCIEASTGQIRPTISLGLAVSSPRHHSAELLFAAADRALYSAKLAGRDRVTLDADIEPLSVLQPWQPPRNVDV